MIYFLILIDANGFEKQVMHDSLSPLYRIALTRKLVTYDLRSNTTLADLLEGKVGTQPCGYDIRTVCFENTGTRDNFGRHIYREIME